jgi:hypothetical protein
MGYPKLFFDNRFADAVPVASSTAAGDYAAANVADARPYTWWQPTALPATLTVDCGAAKAADYLAIYGHNLHTQGATVAVHGSTDNFVASDVLIGTVIPGSDDPFLLEFASANYRYWRLVVTGGAAMPSLAIVLIGAALVMPHHLPVGFDPRGRDVISQSNSNEDGQPLGTIIDFEQMKKTLQFTVPQAWVRSDWEPAWKSNLRGSPFGFAWDSVNYPAELQLFKVPANSGFQAPHNAGSMAVLSVDVIGVAT